MMVGILPKNNLLSHLLSIIDFSSRSMYDNPSNSQAKIRIQLKYDSGKLFVMVRYANNLVR